MKQFFVLLLTGLIVFTFACNDTPSKTSTEPALDTKAMEKSVMKIHDEAMAKMDVIYKLKKQVKGIADSLQQDSIANSETLTAAYKNIEALELADESMMSWMRNYQIPKTKDTPEVMKYLEDEKEKIQEVSQLMNMNIAEAEGFVKMQAPN